MTPPVTQAKISTAPLAFARALPQSHVQTTPFQTSRISLHYHPSPSRPRPQSSHATPTFSRTAGRCRIFAAVLLALPAAAGRGGGPRDHLNVEDTGADARSRPPGCGSWPGRNLTSGPLRGAAGLLRRLSRRRQFRRAGRRTEASYQAVQGASGAPAGCSSWSMRAGWNGLAGSPLGLQFGSGGRKRSRPSANGRLAGSSSRSTISTAPTKPSGARRRSASASTRRLNRCR